MHRKARSLFLPLTFGLIFSTPFLGCRQTGGTSNGGSGGSGGSKSGGSGGNSSGGSGGSSTAKGGSGGNSGGSGGNSGGSGGNSGGSGGNSGGSGGGSGGTTAKGGSGGNSGGSGGNSGGSGGNSGGSGGNSGGSGGNSGGSGGNSGGSGGNSGGSGGNSGGSGGTSAGGTSGGAGSGAGGTSVGGGGSTAPADMISDFEDSPGNATMDPNGGRTGYWYVYFPGSDTGTAPKSGMTISPALNNGKPVLTAKDSSNNALHFTGSGYGASSGDNYAGTGAAFHPNASNYKISEAYDVTSYTGISFKVKAGSGTQPALFFEVLTKENQPSTAGGSATNQKIDLYNTRGQILYTPWTATAVSSSWQTITVPFGTLVPRWVPDSTGCGTAPSTPKCQASPLVPKDVLGIQISSYQDNGFPKASGATAGTFDIWIDDVQFTKDDSGLQKRTGFPIASSSSGAWGSCIKPQGPSADAKYLVPAYNQWKSTFVKNNAVIRPENANDTVSEAMAYGMLIAVNMNDQTLFDSLYGYWSDSSHTATGTLMTWCIPGAGGGGGTGSACSASGGSATDADEDTAFALLQAGKAWGGSYKSKAMTMISDIWSKDIDSGTLLPKGGSNYGAPTGTSGTGITNASYFAPAYYAAFKAAGDSNNWDGVSSAVYTAIGAIAGSNGLIPAWCGNKCTVAASNGASTDTDYQYDSHRIPMRIGLDYCWNGSSANAAAAKAYTTKNTAFFVSQASSGIGYVLDMYTPSGGAVSGTAPNSASILGTSAVGAMATGNQTYLNDAYMSVFDSITRGTMAPVDAAGKTPYSYYNATVGLLTALMMTGNFMH